MTNLDTDPLESRLVTELCNCFRQTCFCGPAFTCPGGAGRSSKTCRTDIEAALPAMQIPFFSNTFVLAYLWAKAIVELLRGDICRCGTRLNSLEQLPKLIRKEDWEVRSFHPMPSSRFSIFFAVQQQLDSLSERGYKVRHAKFFSYKHRYLVVDLLQPWEGELDFDGLARQLQGRKVRIISDLPDEAARLGRALHEHARSIYFAKRQRPLSDVFLRPTDEIRVFLFGSPRSVTYANLYGKSRDGGKVVIVLGDDLRWQPQADTMVAVHHRYQFDADYAQDIATALSKVSETCTAAAEKLTQLLAAIKKGEPATASEQHEVAALSDFFDNVCTEYNRYARSHAPESCVTGLNGDGYGATYARSIYEHQVGATGLSLSS